MLALSIPHSIAQQIAGEPITDFRHDVTYDAYLKLISVWEATNLLSLFWLFCSSNFAAE